MARTRRAVPVELPPDASVRERIMSTACRLFYDEGIQAVGIQRLIDEAGIAKASLYAHFPSKDDVVAAYLERKGGEWRAEVQKHLDNPRLSARAKILKIFDITVAMVERLSISQCQRRSRRSRSPDPRRGKAAAPVGAGPDVPARPGNRRGFARPAGRLADGAVRRRVSDGAHRRRFRIGTQCALGGRTHAGLVTLNKRIDRVGSFGGAASGTQVTL
jgi:AcrR family transcriptional regulator